MSVNLLKNGELVKVSGGGGSSIATTDSPGIVQPDNSTINVDENGVISSTNVDTTARASIETLNGSVSTIGSVDYKIAQAVGNLSGFEVVAAIPVQNPNTKTIYLVKDTSAAGSDKYKEYIWNSTDGYILIGDTSIDLSNYVENTDYATSSVGGVVKIDGTNMSISNGVIIALKVNGYTVATDVPSDAVFTDTQHTIVNENGTSFTKRSKLKFINATITDDATNDTTIVEVEGGGTTIVRKPTVNVGTYTYDGTAQGPTITGLDNDKVVVTNATKVNAGTYTLTIALKNSSTMVWNDMTTADLTYNYTIAKATLTIPTVSGSFTYDGTQKSATIINYDSSTMTQTGDAVGTNAGTYHIYFNLKDSDNYQWSDGTITQKDKTWSIAKANPTFSLDKSSVTLNADAPSATVTITYNGDGTLSASGYDSSLVTVSLSNKTITITGKDVSGSTSITVSAAASNNYNAGSDQTCSISCEYLQLVSWSSGTDDQIGAMIDAYYAGTATLAQIKSVWSVGDVRTVTLSAMSATGVGESHRSQSVEMQIIDFDHDTLTTSQGGKTKALITIDLKNCLRDASVSDTGGSGNTEHGYMNSSNTNAGGWTSCARRTWCNNVYYNALPTYLKNRVKPVNKLTSAGNQSATINTDSDKCFLLSEIEIFGSVTYSKAGEGSQYAHYATGSNRYKLPKWISSYVSDLWWERSPSGSNAAGFCRVYYNGNANYVSASNALGLSPACCL